MVLHLGLQVHATWLKTLRLGIIHPCCAPAPQAYEPTHQGSKKPQPEKTQTDSTACMLDFVGKLSFEAEKVSVAAWRQLAHRNCTRIQHHSECLSTHVTESYKQRVLRLHMLIQSHGHLGAFCRLLMHSTHIQAHARMTGSDQLFILRSCCWRLSFCKHSHHFSSQHILSAKSRMVCSVFLKAIHISSRPCEQEENMSKATTIYTYQLLPQT